MDVIKLKLLVPACCPNCGYDLQPDNQMIPVKLMNARGTPKELETVEGLFNYVKPAEPPKAPAWPRSRTPPRERRSPYYLKSTANEEDGRRSRTRSKGRGRNRKLKYEPDAGPPINPIQKRLLEIASNDADDMRVASPEPDDNKIPPRGASEPPVPVVVTMGNDSVPAIPHVECSAPCSQFKQNEVYQLLTEFLDDVSAQQTDCSDNPKAQIPTEAPRPNKLPWHAYRVFHSETVPPHREPFGVVAPAAGFLDPGLAVAPAPPVGRGRVVAIHNHFYGETVVIPDTP